MDRRAFLAGLGGLAGVAGLASLAGCQAPTANAGRQVGRLPTFPSDISLPVPESEIVHDPHSAILAIDDPAFAADWSDVTVETDEGVVTAEIPADSPVIGVERDGEARAYPLLVLQWHEVVNDDFGGPLLVSYCPICASGMAAVREVDGVETIFEVSHRLWRSNLVLRDRLTGTLWSQVLATAIRGPETGDQLRLLPASMTTWGAWRETHPDTEVLLPPPYSSTVFFDSDTVESPGPIRDRYLRPPRRADKLEKGFRRLVIGVATDEAARAYPFDTVAREGVINDTVGSLPVVVTMAPGETLVAYDRRVGDRTLTFEETGENRLGAGGSSWAKNTGRAVDGPFRGQRLESANEIPPLFEFTWKDFHADTTVYGES